MCPWGKKALTFSLKSTRLIRTPHYYGQFAVSLGKESSYIFPKFKTDTPLIQTLSLVPAMWFDCTVESPCATLYPKHEKFPSRSLTVVTSRKPPPIVSDRDHLLGPTVLYFFYCFLPGNHLMHDLISMPAVCTMPLSVYVELLATT